MAYDESLAERIRHAIETHPGVTEKKMFGGLAFLRQGRMFCGVAKEELMVRVGPEKFDEFLREPDVRPMDFTGRPMKGYVFVEPSGCRTEKAVRTWVKRGIEFVATLPEEKTPKPSKPAAKKTRSPKAAPHDLRGLQQEK